MPAGQAATAHTCCWSRTHTPNTPALGPSCPQQHTKAVAAALVNVAVAITVLSQVAEQGGGEDHKAGVSQEVGEWGVLTAHHTGG